MIFLSATKISNTTETSAMWTQNILYNVRNLLLMHVGIKDYEEDLSKNIFDRLKKQLKILDKVVDQIFI